MYLKPLLKLKVTPYFAYSQWTYNKPTVAVRAFDVFHIYYFAMITEKEKIEEDFKSLDKWERVTNSELEF